jgi:hypothetical protein
MKVSKEKVMNRREMMLASTAAVTGLTGLTENVSNLPVVVFEDGEVKNIKELFALAGEWKELSDNLVKKINVYLPKENSIFSSDYGDLDNFIYWGEVELSFEFYADEPGELVVWFEETEKSDKLKILGREQRISYEDIDFCTREADKYIVKKRLLKISKSLENGSISKETALEKIECLVSGKGWQSKINKKTKECFALAKRLKEIAALPNAKDLASILK